MKKLIITVTLILFAGITYGQSLQKGNLIGIHVFSIDLDPNVTMNQWQDFFANKVIPEMDKHFPDLKHYFTKGIRGEDKNYIGLIVLYESKEIKNKYYNEDGSRTEFGNSVYEKLQPTLEELYKLGTVTAEYTDWVIQ